jgi:ATP-dependent RNA helicase SUPV3L1/SUV3
MTVQSHLLSGLVKPINADQSFMDYANHFILARQLKRQHHFYVGPTNSGKTHEALNALMKAESGIYLAPLRLLAMEIRDRLVAAGVPCNLITGEERVLMDGAKHTASTIEMMRSNQSVSVAVIDEIQMLQDPDRGSAWTAALIGAPAKTVFICGSNAVTHLCTHALTLLNEPFTLTQLERKTPLVLEEKSLCGKRYKKQTLKHALQKGDALIAFSRKDVLTFAARFRNWGYSVATIYGALSPEVRRHESNRFNQGEADILVATDAIGMGLNLPIRRILFANTHKFDGIATRPLNPTEVRQIAGRAGRFGVYPVGYVAVLEDDERIHIADMLYKSDLAEIISLPIALPFLDLQSLANQLHTNRLAECIQALNGLFKGSSLLHLTVSQSQLQQAKIIDEVAPNMALTDKFVLACAPLSLQVPIEKDYFIQCILSVYTNQVRAIPQLPVWVDAKQSKHLAEAEILSQHLSIYAWLSYKFPSIFQQQLGIAEFRMRVSDYIKQALLTQSGYGDTSKELDQSQHRH